MVGENQATLAGLIKEKQARDPKTWLRNVVVDVQDNPDYSRSAKLTAIMQMAPACLLGQDPMRLAKLSDYIVKELRPRFYTVNYSDRSSSPPPSPGL